MGCSNDNTRKNANAFNSILTGHRSPDWPGVAAIVVKNGDVLFRSAYGMANLEKNIALKPEMTFRIGSLTKSFTAAAILLLADQGKLKVTDEITNYLSGYPTHGKKITIAHLLSHTSGIKNYTNLAEFQKKMNKDLPLAQVIDLFKNEPMEFEPGTRFAYSNSGYILLGAIIEHVSGQPYCAFMQQQIFNPLKMHKTQCERTDHRNLDTIGYTRKERADPISMTQTYSAGALISTVDDLALWNGAISAGKLLKPETWQQALSPFTLKNGQASEAGYGWGIGSVKGRPAAGHEGKVNGFSSMMIRLTNEDIFVAVLSNDDQMHLMNKIESWFYDNSPAAIAGHLTVTTLAEQP